MAPAREFREYKSAILKRWIWFSAATPAVGRVLVIIGLAVRNLYEVRQVPTLAAAWGCIVVLVACSAESETKQVSETISYYAKFYNPVVVEGLYKKQPDLLSSLPAGPARDSVVFYVVFAADKVEERCGTFLSIESAFMRGTVRLAMTAYSVGIPFAALAEENSDTSTRMMGDWWNTIQDISTIEKQAGRDIDLYLADQGTCTHQSVYALQDGMERFFRVSRQTTQ